MSHTAIDIPANPPEPENHIFGLPMPMAAIYKLKGEAIGNDRSRISMPHQADFSNSRGDMHGGAMATLLDVGLASAARSHDPKRFGVLTVDLTIHYIASTASDVVCISVCEKRGRSLSFARGEILDAAGELVAIATGTFKLVDRTKI